MHAWFLKYFDTACKHVDLSNTSMRACVGRVRAAHMQGSSTEIEYDDCYG